MKFAKTSRVILASVFLLSQSSTVFAQSFCEEQLTGMPESWRLPVLKTISFFETSKEDGFGDVTPDFDCQGISAGTFQWNVGTGSLPPLLVDIQKRDPASFDAIMGPFAQQVSAVMQKKSAGGGHPDAMRYVRSLQTFKDAESCKAKMRGAAFSDQGKDFKERLKALLTSPAGRAEQMIRVTRKYNVAWNYASWWVNSNPDRKRQGDKPTLREVALFADTLIFNGCFSETANYRLVQAFKANKPPGKAFNEVLDYLLTKQPVEQVQLDEARKNSALWRGKSPDAAQLDLLVFSYLVAKNIKSDPKNAQFRFNVIGRRGTIVFNDGHVNGVQKTFPDLN